jgi:glycogen(starch) synthase
MHVLMLGWEFPPFIAGGLGTACHGLTKAMDRRGMRVTFVLPKVIDRSEASHVNLLSPDAVPSPRPAATAAPATPDLHIVHAGDGKAVVVESSEQAHAAAQQVGQQKAETHPAELTPEKREAFENVRFIAVPAGFNNPYQRTSGDQPAGRWVIRRGLKTFLADDQTPEVGDIEPVSYEALQSAGQAVHGATASSSHSPVAPAPGEDYGGDLLHQVHRFEQFVIAAARNLQFDVIHAHDWMTYPAGLAIARLTGKPLVVHVHSTEFDRSGVHVNQRVYDIERRGMHGAMRVVAVSQLTKNVIMRRYGIPEPKVDVVYNGVELEPTQGEHVTGIQSKDKIVLYFGRITYQKGPEYFIQAARRVLEYMSDVKFVVAGSGDQATRMIEMAAHLGIGHKVLFTGFLRGRDIRRVFALADLYVMPSVSEPFGIAPLEAMSNDVPVLISKTSGVSEVLTHALKADFWDIDDIADKIIAVLRHPPLSQTLRTHGAFEVRKITWDGAAAKCERVYQNVMNEMHSRMIAKA